jgi:hypothetical protein
MRRLAKSENRANDELRTRNCRKHGAQKKEKPRRGGEAFFFSYPLFSEYQVETKKPPNIFEGIRVEVVWNEGQNFRTARGKLDKFSTFGENSLLAVACGR